MFVPTKEPDQFTATGVPSNGQRVSASTNMRVHGCSGSLQARHPHQAQAGRLPRTRAGRAQDRAPLPLANQLKGGAMRVRISSLVLSALLLSADDDDRCRSTRRPAPPRSAGPAIPRYATLCRIRIVLTPGGDPPRPCAVAYRSDTANASAGRGNPPSRMRRPRCPKAVKPDRRLFRPRQKSTNWFLHLAPHRFGCRGSPPDSRLYLSTEGRAGWSRLTIPLPPPGQARFPPSYLDAMNKVWRHHRLHLPASVPVIRQICSAQWQSDRAAHGRSAAPAGRSS